MWTTSRGALCVWVEETRGGSADVFAVGVERDGSLRGVPARLMRGVTSWQVTPTASGAGLALVVRDEGSAPDAKPKDSDKAAPPKTTDKGERVVWLRVDQNAQRQDEVVLDPAAHVSGDVDVTRTIEPVRFYVAGAGDRDFAVLRRGAQV